MSSRLGDSAQPLLRSTFITLSLCIWRGFKRRNLDMSILAWIVLGLLAGFIGSKIVNKSGEGVIVDILLGIVGAVLGGWLFNRFGAAGVTGLNLYSLLVAVVGSVVFLVIYHAIR